VLVGLTTAIFAKFAGEVQTDIKSALTFASMTQVGLIFVEIGLGFQYLALIHILGHGCLRTLQFLRAPTILHDYRTMEDAIGERLPQFSGAWLSRISEQQRTWFYRLALERGYLDAFLKVKLVKPFLDVLRRCDSLERRWTLKLSGKKTVEPIPSETPATLEELL
jgi:NADH-quinone oxidoreductase subunit L